MIKPRIAPKKRSRFRPHAMERRHRSFGMFVENSWLAVVVVPETEDEIGPDSPSTLHRSPTS